MKMSRIFAVLLALASISLLLTGCGDSEPFTADVAGIQFGTTEVPAAGAGQYYDATIAFETTGGAALPDRFAVSAGVLPPGVSLVPGSGAQAGSCMLQGYPRQAGSFSFTIQALSDSGYPADLAAVQPFTIDVGEGGVAVLNPTTGPTTDPTVPAFPEVIDFVNPANPQAFFSFAFTVAGGSADRINNLYVPRELELSTFDVNIVAEIEEVSFDTDESPTSDDILKVDISDGGWFSLQAGNNRVQVGGFQSPRGPVGTITEYSGGAGLNPVWFQVAAGDGGPAQNSRRDLADTLGMAGGDNTLGTERPVQFSDYFAPNYEGTWPTFHEDGFEQRKYPFDADEYNNAFFMPYTEGVDLTPLRFRLIVEAIDTRGTLDRQDDILDRKAYVAQIKIPDLKVDTLVLADGICGVDYTEIIASSGGVPPLTRVFEWIDATLDFTTTEGDDLNKQDFGVELNTATGRFFGLPRAYGMAELTVCVTAAVLNPIQGAETYLPNGATEGQYVGKNPLTGIKGVHQTYQVNFADPSPPVLTNGSIAGGIDGTLYPGDRLVGTGGVPLLRPYPVGFTGDYPGNADRNYDWTGSYVRDISHSPNEGTVDPDRELPNNLVLDGAATSGTNGAITGTTYDRGFHPVTFGQTDFCIGSTVSPDTTAFRQFTTKSMALSVSPDQAVYMRGATAAQSGTPTGLHDETLQKTEPLMVPLWLEAAVFAKESGSPAVIADSAIPRKMDLIPLLIANGGSDAHVEKNVPSLSGFWPAESGKLVDWRYYYYGYTDRAFKHFTQDTVWIQIPNEDQTRVFLFGETDTKKSNDDYQYGRSRYQIYDSSGERGVMCLNPLSNEVWFPAVLDNDQYNPYSGGSDSGGDGGQFGAENVVACGGTSPTISSYGYYYYYGNGFYEGYYNYLYWNQGRREARCIGIGPMLEPYDQTYYNHRTTLGRIGSSVAVSSDGVWCATTLPGTTTPKILIWRTDKQPISSTFESYGHTMVDGVDAVGNAVDNSACILDVGGGSPRTTQPWELLPDSLMFVENGLIFLFGHDLRYVHGISLTDGHYSYRYLNTGRQGLGTAGTGYTVQSLDGQYVPDTDWLRGFCGTTPTACQFSFTGNAAADGEEGPNKVAFVAGDGLRKYAFNDYSSTYTRMFDAPRWGFAYAAQGRKSVMFLELDTTGANGLEMSSSTLKDLTGNNSNVYGDLLSPGRPGEELDFLRVSPDGNFVAVVRERDWSSYAYSSYYSMAPNAHAHYYYYYSSYSYYNGTDDLLLMATDASIDMDSGTSGNQTVLILGTTQFSNGSTTPPPGNSAGYCTGRAYLNGQIRRVNGLRFAPDSRTLIFTYAGSDYYSCKCSGSTYGYALNGSPNQSSVYQKLACQLSVRFEFRNSSGNAINFTSSPTSFLKNNLADLSASGISSFGDTAAPFTLSTSGQQQFWATFQSSNGKFLYYISDQLSGRNYMVGLNMTDTAIGGRDPWEPFTNHPTTVGFEQFDLNCLNYEMRFFAVPAGSVNNLTGRDGDGIVFVIGSDASAGAQDPYDLEVYAFDANNGGDMVCLTSNVTDGDDNAINHIYASSDGNFLVGQRAEYGATSNNTRAPLQHDTDIFAVTNVHAALFSGAVPNDFMISEDRSHGTTMSFVGDGSATGAQAVIFSAADTGTTVNNDLWKKRTLRVGLLSPGGTTDVLDSTESHYVVLAGDRKVDDDWQSSD